MGQCLSESQSSSCQGLGLRSDTLVKPRRMHDRLHWHRDGLCHSPYVQHVTPLLTQRLGNQKILKGWDVLNTEIKTKKKDQVWAVFAHPAFGSLEVSFCCVKFIYGLHLRNTRFGLGLLFV